MDSKHELEAQLTRLLIGLSDQKIKDGDKFNYDGSELFAYDVGMIALPSALCLADVLSKRLGMGGSGFEFYVGEPNPVFPIQSKQLYEKQFLQIAPFLTEVFEGIVYEMRHDLSQVYVTAVQAMSLELELELEQDTDLGMQFGQGDMFVQPIPEAVASLVGSEGAALER